MLRWKEGSFYKGGFSQGKLDGYGEETCKDGNTNIYEDYFTAFYTMFLNSYHVIKFIKDKKLRKYEKIDIIYNKKILQIKNGKIQLKKIFKEEDNDSKNKSHEIKTTDNKEEINERFEKIFEEHHDQYKKICEDMEEICNRIYKYENLIKEYENKYNSMIENVNKSIANIYVREDVQIVQERIIKTVECNFLQEQINDIHNALQTCNLQFNENMNELNKGSNSTFQLLEKQLKDQKNEIIKMGDANKLEFEKFKINSDNIEVKQMVNEMVTKVDNLLLMESMQNSKNVEYNIMKTIEEHNSNIMNSLNEIKNNKEDISVLKDKVTTIQNSLDASGQNMSGMAEQMKKMREEAHELEMKESVGKVMDLIVTNIENTLTKERMDKMSQFDLNKMRETILELEDKYNSLSNTNTEIETIKENINLLNSEQEILKNQPKGGDDIKLATIQMLNNVEFENIYSLLNNAGIGESKEEPDASPLGKTHININDMQNFNQQESSPDINNKKSSKNKEK